jgi:hypothetical protein
MIDDIKKVTENRLAGRDDVIYFIYEHEKDDALPGCIVVKLLHKPTSRETQRIFPEKVLAYAIAAEVIVADAVDCMLCELDGRNDK